MIELGDVASMSQIATGKLYFRHHERYELQGYETMDIVGRMDVPIGSVTSNGLFLVSGHLVNGLYLNPSGKDMTKQIGALPIGHVHSMPIW